MSRDRHHSKRDDPVCVETRGARFGLMDATAHWMTCENAEAGDALANAMRRVIDLLDTPRNDVARG